METASQKDRAAYAETAPKYQGPATCLFHGLGVFHVNQPQRARILGNEIVASPNRCRKKNPAKVLEK